MITIKKQDIEKAANIFANAMFNDDVHVYFFPNKSKRLKKLQFLYKFKLKSHFTNVFKSSLLMEGLSIWEKPNSHNNAISLIDVLYGFSLIFQIGLNDLFKMIKYQLWSTKIRESLIKDPYWYLEVIAVHPDYQGKGFASKMIKPILELAIKNSENLYLETQNINNVVIYEKYGFKLVHSEQIPRTIVTHYCMIKSNN